MRLGLFGKSHVPPEEDAPLAPYNVLAVEPVTNPPSFEFDVSEDTGTFLDLAANDVIRIQVAHSSDPEFNSVNIEATHTVVAGDLDNLILDGIDVNYNGTTADGSTNFIARMRIERPSPNVDSDWSENSDPFELPVYDSTQATLSSATGTATGDDTATLSVSTTLGSGNLYWVVTTSATKPTALQVKLGLTHLGAAAPDSGSQAVVGTGVQSISGGASGLSSETAYYAHYMHESNQLVKSSVATSSVFTTEVTAPVTLGTVQHGEDPDPENPYTYTAGAIGTAAAGRVIAVMVSTRPAPSTIAVTVGGTSLTQRTSSSSAIATAYLFSGVVATGTSADVVVTTTGGPTTRLGVGVYPIYGAASAVPHDTDTSTAEPSAATITVPVNGAAIGYVWANNATSYTWTGLTERFDAAVETTLIHSGASATYHAGGDLAISADALGGSVADRCSIFASWGP